MRIELLFRNFQFSYLFFWWLLPYIRTPLRQKLLHNKTAPVYHSTNALMKPVNSLLTEMDCWTSGILLRKILAQAISMCAAVFLLEKYQLQPKAMKDHEDVDTIIPQYFHFLVIYCWRTMRKLIMKREITNVNSLLSIHWLV